MFSFAGEAFVKFAGEPLVCEVGHVFELEYFQLIADDSAGDAAFVDSPCGGDGPDLPGPCPCGEAVVAVASDEDEVWVEEAYFGNHFLSEDHAGAVDPEDGFVFCELRARAVAVLSCGEGLEAAGVDDVVGDFGRELQWCADAAFRMRVHEPEHLLDGVGLEVHILVEHDDVWAVVGEEPFYAFIYGGGEIDVVLIVISDEYLDGKGLFFEVGDTFFKLFFAAVGGDYDGDLLAACAGQLWFAMIAGRFGNQLRQVFGHVMKDVGPLAGLCLAKEPHRGIPWAVTAVEQPLPGWRSAEDGPGGFAHSCGQVGHAGIDGDDEVEVFNYGGGIGEVVEVLFEVDDGDLFGGFVELCGRAALLQAVQLDAFDGGQRQEIIEATGAEVVPFVDGGAGPDDADVEMVAGYSFAPVVGLCGVGVEIGHVGGDVGKRGFEDAGQVHQ